MWFICDILRGPPRCFVFEVTTASLGSAAILSAQSCAAAAASFHGSQSNKLKMRKLYTYPPSHSLGGVGGPHFVVNQPLSLQNGSGTQSPSYKMVCL